MKLLVIGAALAATFAAALPAAAQVVIREGGDRVVVRKHVDRGHHYGWRRHRAECRVVKVRTRHANGTVVVKTRRVC